ncbi:SpoIIE family protein phosphatase [Pseudobutyrivibrio xylanivorans]|nr:SpoIIE family protein phosphatase [Pseudobutyrivibrio xylanivorans]
MKKKVMRIMMIVSSLLLVMFVIITFYITNRVKRILLDNSENSETQVEQYTDKAMRDAVTEQLTATTMGCAYVMNETFRNFAGSVEMIADSATEIYSNPDKYGRAKIEPLEKSDLGRIMGQFVYAEDVNPTDAAVLEELYMIGNLEGSMLAMYEQYPELGAVSIGTETGLMFLAGPVLEERWDADGNYSHLDARKRPWYIGAKETESAYYAEVTPDYDTGRLAIMCGAPIYKEDDFVGVAGAGLYLEGIESMMMNARISDAGTSCVIDRSGKILFSSSNEGELQRESVLGDKGDSVGFNDIVNRASEGKDGLAHMDVNGVRSFVAYYPIETVGWTLISIVPEELVLAPNESLLASLKDNHLKEMHDVQATIGASFLTIIMLIIIIGIAVAVTTNILSNHLVEPIEELTYKVENLDGDQLDFQWNKNTGDEVQKLANSFGLMTERMKEYIVDIKNATAEKERIGTELTLATKIQLGMLPHDFPPFPDRDEFDIFATMTPARKVGGDFYDYFLIDEDHLGLVMADVSGKGIPAALFMMISKTILQSCAMLGKSAGETLTKANEALSANNQTDMFVTVWFGILEISSGKLTCANAGHEYPALKRADGAFELFKDKHGLVIGGMEGIRYKEYEILLNHGDKIFLYTDGVPEATDADVKMYGTSRMIEALNQNPDASPQDIVTIVHNDVNAFVKEAEQFDDLTMMCVEYH